MLRRGCKKAFKTCALSVKRFTLIKILASFIILFSAVKFISCTPTPTKKIITEPLYFPEAYTKEGLLHYQKRDFEKAIAYFEKAIAINHYYQPAHSYLAASFAHLGRKQGAITEFHRVIEIDPASKEAMNAKKWLERLSNPTTVAVLSFKSIPKRASNLENMATKEFIRILKNTEMYRVMNLSDVAYSQTPSSSELERLIEMAEKRGAKILILPRTIKFAARALYPVDIKRNGGKATVGLCTESVSSHGLFASGNLTMSITVYSCRKREPITSIFKECSETFLFSSLNSAARSLYKSCSEESIKELLKQVL